MTAHPPADDGPGTRGPAPGTRPERPTLAAQLARGLAYGAGIFVLFDALRRLLP